MRSIPNEAQSYKRTPLFDEKSIPKGLLKDHKTKKDVWGKIHVVKGKLIYTIQSNPAEIVELGPEAPGIVEPEVLHNVKPDGSVQFYVEFYK